MYGIPADIPALPATGLLCSALAFSLDAGAFPHTLFAVFLPSSQMLLALLPLFSEILCLNTPVSFRNFMLLILSRYFIFARVLLVEHPLLFEDSLILHSCNS